jgi:hypothetical protein
MLLISVEVTIKHMGCELVCLRHAWDDFALLNGVSLPEICFLPQYLQFALEKQGIMQIKYLVSRG